MVNFKSIVLVAVVLLVGMVSCSLDDNCLMDTDNNGDINNPSDVLDREVYLSFQLNTGGLAKDLKFSSDTLSHVFSCSVVLFTNNNQILSVTDGVEVVNGELQDFRLFTKVRNDLNVAIIANTTKLFQNSATMKEVRRTVQDAADLENLVKYGEAKVSMDNITGMPSTSGVPVVSVHVMLKQLAAIVELDSFKVVFEENAPVVDVIIKEVALGSANVEYYTNAFGLSKEATFARKMEMNVNDFSKVDFRTFPSTGVYIAVTLQVGAEEVYRRYKINKGFVESGYIYRLNVILTQRARGVELDFSVYNISQNYLSGPDLKNTRKTQK